MKFAGQGFQRLEHEPDRHTDRQTDATEFITMPQTEQNDKQQQQQYRVESKHKTRQAVYNSRSRLDRGMLLERDSFYTDAERQN